MLDFILHFIGSGHIKFFWWLRTCCDASCFLRWARTDKQSVDYSERTTLCCIQGERRFIADKHEKLKKNLAFEMVGWL